MGFSPGLRIAGSREPEDDDREDRARRSRGSILKLTAAST
jgi:hypothetical protein